MFALAVMFASTPWVKNQTTVSLLTPGIDPCTIDPALCDGASADESPEADCSSHFRRESVMLNLIARSAELQAAHAVVVFPGSGEAERVRFEHPH